MPDLWGSLLSCATMLVSKSQGLFLEYEEDT